MGAVANSIFLHNQSTLFHVTIIQSIFKNFCTIMIRCVCFLSIFCKTSVQCVQYFFPNLCTREWLKADAFHQRPKHPAKGQSIWTNLILFGFNVLLRRPNVIILLWKFHSSLILERNLPELRWTFQFTF